MKFFEFVMSSLGTCTLWHSGHGCDDKAHHGLNSDLCEYASLQAEQTYSTERGSVADWASAGDDEDCAADEEAAVKEVGAGTDDATSAGAYAGPAPPGPAAGPPELSGLDPADAYTGRPYCGKLTPLTLSLLRSLLRFLCLHRASASRSSRFRAGVRDGSARSGRRWDRLAGRIAPDPGTDRGFVGGTPGGWVGAGRTALLRFDGTADDDDGTAAGLGTAPDGGAKTAAVAVAGRLGQVTVALAMAAWWWVGPRDTVADAGIAAGFDAALGTAELAVTLIRRAAWVAGPSYRRSSAGRAVVAAAGRAADAADAGPRATAETTVAGCLLCPITMFVTPEARCAAPPTALLAPPGAALTLTASRAPSPRATCAARSSSSLVLLLSSSLLLNARTASSPMTPGCTPETALIDDSTWVLFGAMPA